MLLIGANPRQEQPLLNHRLRKAALRGASVMALNSIRYDFNYELTFTRVAAPSRLPEALAALTAACQGSGAEYAEAAVTAAARPLREARHARVLLGESALAHPRYDELQRLAATLAQSCGATLGYLAPGANAYGAWFINALPGTVAKPGEAAYAPAESNGASTPLDALGMLRDPRAAYLLLGLEAELDCWDGRLATQALRQARLVISLSGYRTPAMLEYAHLLLPIALYAENEGSYLNLDGRLRSFSAAARPPGEARPAWRVLRVLGDKLGLEGFGQHRVEELRADLPVRPSGDSGVPSETSIAPPDSVQDAARDDPMALELCVDRAMYSVDALARRASALQATVHAADATLRLHPAAAARLGLGARARLRRHGEAWVLPVVRDPRVPEDCLYLRMGHPLLAEVGAPHGRVTLEAVS